MDMPNPYEVLVRNFLKDVTAGEHSPVDDQLIEEAGEHFKAALKKQFREGNRKDFRLRMSNLGKPTCQLWYSKNQPEAAENKPYDFLMRMLLGDAIEVLSLFILKAAGVNVEDSSGKVEMDLDGLDIMGEYDLVIDGKVWDIKSASPYSFQSKFKSFDAMKEGDSFGYVAQGYGYARATGKPFGGWIAINKSTGEWAFVEAPEDAAAVKEVEKNMIATKQYIATDAPFERCFEDVEEKFRGKPTGNRTLPINCSFCDYKHTCWPGLQYKPQAKSQAKNPKYFYYSVYNEDA
jgi:hypothetical protein